MALTDLQVAQNRGDAVIGLFERAQVSPVPVLYALAYDYVAGVQSLGAQRVGSLMAEPGDGQAAPQLYEEFIRPYEIGDKLETVIATMTERLSALDGVLVERQEVSRSQSQSLAEATTSLEASPPNLELMREWIAKLAAANERARQANARLRGELEIAADRIADVRDEIAQFSRDALIDPVTVVANRAGLDSSFAAAMEAARTDGEGIALAVVDIDHFKHINDTYGHPTGDAVLKLAARALLASVRSADVVGRMGGDEFVVLLRDLRRGTGAVAAETMRRAVLGMDLGGILGRDVLGGISASIGVAHYRDGDSISSFLERADRCLLEAKREGRNRVVADEVEPQESQADAVDAA